MVPLPIYRFLFSHHCKPRHAQSACERASLSVTYISPSDKISYHDMTDLIVQLPPPFILMSDTNAMCELWGGTTTDPHGRIFEQLLNMNIGLLNSGAHTKYHTQTNSSSAIDLSLCSPELLPEFSWRVDNDLHGSDHYPIIVEDITREPIVRPMQYIIKKAYWKLFTARTVMQDDNEHNCDGKFEQANRNNFGCC